MTKPYRHVTYLALGHHRIQAAQQYCAGLAGEGSKVTLITADLPEWRNWPPPPGTTHHRVPGEGPSVRWRHATRLLRRMGDQLHGTDLLVAGDPDAMPVAHEVVRRHPGLPVRREPHTSEGPVEPCDIAVLTPWHPSPNDEFAGAFVAVTNRAIAPNRGNLTVFHTEAWKGPRKPAPRDMVKAVQARLPLPTAEAAVSTAGDGLLVRCPVPVDPRSGYAARARAQVAALRRLLPGGRIDAPLVHAHVGIYGGVQACRLARPDARVVVTEHASFLPRVFKQPDARALYDEMLGRADVLLCVGSHLVDQIADEFPHHADKLRVVPNVVDFDRFPARRRPPADLLRWLYVGRLLEDKGVEVLLEAFARAAATEPRMTLTLLGTGPLEQKLKIRAAALGLSDRLTLHPPVPPEQVAGIMHRHDLLVHASRYETFGMTVVEGVAAGLPVLVTRCQGPERTLAGLETAAGVLVDVSDDPEVLVAGYRTLRQRRSQLDLAGARRTLVERYGADAVAALLHRAYSGGELPPPVHRQSRTRQQAARVPVAPQQGPETAQTREPERRSRSGRLIVVATMPKRHRRIRRFLDSLVEQGWSVSVVTSDLATAKRLKPADGITVHPIRNTLRPPLFQWLEQLALQRVPGRVLQLCLRRAARLRSPGPQLALIRVRELHRRFAGATHNWLFEPLYGLGRPLRMWLTARRTVVPALELDRTACVVVCETTDVPIGWHLARRHPDLAVTTSMTVPSAVDVNRHPG